MARESVSFLTLVLLASCAGEPFGRDSFPELGAAGGVSPTPPASSGAFSVGGAGGAPDVLGGAGGSPELMGGAGGSPDTLGGAGESPELMGGAGGSPDTLGGAGAGGAPFVCPEPPSCSGSVHSDYCTAWCSVTCGQTLGECVSQRCQCAL